MIGASRFRSDEEKDEINGRPVERFKINRARRSREKSEHLFRFGELGMRNSYPIASPGRAETLPLNQSVENFPRREPRKFGGAFAQLLQRLLLRSCLQRRDDRFQSDQVGQYSQSKPSGSRPLI